MKKVGTLLVGIVLLCLLLVGCTANYTVSFNTNGADEIAPVTVKENETLKFPTAPKRAGYTFEGWFLDEALTEAVSDGYVVKSDVTLYAKWTQEFTVSFATNGGTPCADRRTSHGKLSDPPVPERQNFGFGGWYTDEALTQAFNPDAVITSDLKLYAAWRADVYVEFVGANLPRAQVKAGEKLVKPADPAKTGSVFRGWYADADCTVAYDFSAPVTADMKLYAAWDKAMYTVRFLNTKGIKDAVVAYGEKLELPDMTGQGDEGKEFAGWYLDAQLTQAFDVNGGVTGDLQLYARYKDIQFKVCFAVNAVCRQVKWGELLTEPSAPSKTGYTFAGWCTDETCENLYDFSQPVKSDLTLYPKWEPVTLSVVYYSGQEVYLESSVKYDAAVERPADPDKTGYDFLGWYKDQALTKAYDFDVPAQKNLKLYAKFAIQIKTVTFVSEEKPYDTKQATYGETVTKPADPVRVGYNFRGWYVDENYDTVYDFGAAVTDDTFVYAKWEAKLVTATYYEDGWIVVTVDVAYDSLLEPRQPSAQKEGQIFLGWYEENATAPFAVDAPVRRTEDFSLHAKWSGETAGLQFTAGTSSAKLVGIGTAADQAIVIPAVYEGKPVTEIADNAFRNASVTSVYVPDGVTSIGASAFAGSSQLVSVRLPDGLKTLKNNAFENCTALSTINIPDTLTVIPAGLFRNCAALYSLTLSPQTTSILAKAFEGCTSLVTFTVPEKVQTVGANAFLNCTSLETVNIESASVTINRGMFQGCTSLRAVNFSANNTMYKSVDGVVFDRTGENLLFYPYAKRGAEYVVPEGVKVLANGAFSNNSYLKKIVLPATLEQISDAENDPSLFVGCAALEAIEVNPANTVFSSADGVLYNKNKTVLIRYPEGKRGDFTAPDGVAAIADKAAINARGLRSVHTNAVESIGMYAFKNCSALESVYLTDSLRLLGAYAFSDCAKLVDIRMSDGIEDSGDNPFYNTAWFQSQPDGIVYCGSLLTGVKGALSADTVVDVREGTRVVAARAFWLNKNVVGLRLPASVVRIGFNAFLQCPLQPIEVDAANAYLKSVDGNLYSKDGKTFLLYAAAGDAETFVMPEGVETVADQAFSYSKNLREVVLADSVRVIGDGVFDGCENLTKVTFGKSLERVGDGVLYMLSSLTVVMRGETPAQYGMYFNYAGQTHYVPDSAVQAYKDAGYSNVRPMSELSA